MTDDISIGERKLFQGNRYSTGHLFTGVADGATVRFHIRNPADSGVEILLDPISLNSTVKVRTQKLKNATVTDAGTPVNVINKKYDESNGNQTEVFHTPTIDTRGEEFNQETFGGGANNKISGSGSIGADLLPEGTSLIVEVTAQAPSADISLDSNFVEINT